MFSPGKKVEGERLTLVVAGRGEIVWMLTAGAGSHWQGTRLSHEQRSVHPASTRDLVTGCLMSPRTKNRP